MILPLVVPGLRDEHPDCDIRLFEEETDQPQVQELDLMFLDGRVDGDAEHRKLQALARHGVRPHIVCRTAGNETVLSMVRAGMGSAVLPQLTVDSADIGSDASLRVHALEPALAARAIEIAVEVAGRIAERL
ncbi:LysR family transcriptional regulator substrate-binding protein [Streptomyces sp. NPDC059755]|uniref:LysR family transcriptional regulator substrate-binding protein n=1 Tax=Streptomyces sp. NPDC059755 TaxID=3346934 RepID=UPI003665D1C9